RVVGIDMHFPDGYDPLGPARFEEMEADIRDTAALDHALSGATTLFHLASAHLHVNMPDSEYWDINVRAVPLLLERAVFANVRRCVHTSTVGVYGDVGTQPANERTTPKPQA